LKLGDLGSNPCIDYLSKTSTYGYCSIKTENIATSDMPAGQDLILKMPGCTGAALILEGERIDAKLINEVKGGCAGFGRKDPLCAHIWFLGGRNILRGYPDC
jgi:hypothetical protein